MHNPPPPDSKGDRTTAAREIDVASLIGAGREVVLLHRGERYRLRVTANGKLILTK
ncbi:hemin uptake protein HemP [Microvirga thermotolerans]|uniref:Hemin uptake protein HemP n=1 Tax=Microvirga thermotolerans TaxID=2651334 RepID=A0A5P9JUL8_9HYPH|nr:hemin uptake protein HemP [Microvirga thermotolerans]QFU14875.1 hemin uptake protein HemP [Microvirga thermotolerans]